MKDELLRIQNGRVISSEVLYLDNLMFNLGKGELVGVAIIKQFGLEHLIQILNGELKLSNGKLFLNGTKVNRIPFKVSKVVDTKNKLADEMKVYDLIFLFGRKREIFMKSKLRLVHEAMAVLEQLDIQINPMMIISELSDFERIQLEILINVMQGTKLMLLRELGKLLSDKEIERLNILLGRFIKGGVSFIYFGDYPDRFFHYANRIHIFDSGKFSKIFYGKQISESIILDYIDVKFAKTLSEFEICNAPLLTLDKDAFPYYCAHDIPLTKGRCLVVISDDYELLANLRSNFKGFCKQSVEDNLVSLYSHSENDLQEILYMNQSFVFNLILDVEKKAGRRIKRRKLLKSILKEMPAPLTKNLSEKNLKRLSILELYELLFLKILIINPDIVIFHRPFFDKVAQLQVQFMKMLGFLQEKNIAIVILATHSNQWESFAHEIVELRTINRKVGNTLF